MSIKSMRFKKIPLEVDLPSSQDPTFENYYTIDPISLELPISRQEHDLHQYLSNILENLLPREKQILSLRFGLESGRPKTLKEIADLENRTPERIRQIINHSIKKLRPFAESMELSIFL